ncbi:1,4-dihydroxy-2-naphthoate octaprenyltransferase [Enhygromyxa salina]|uniref:1,4-dihydroxy-2-naphthoate octaprenyltransferase n=1 Tax=Enhygromyxa salina TaxID=215803 RepID=A0A2S9YCK7_9BACT|nr:prenyltransferase [Enhygromyxa salina]PRQ02766.1 1,4-dihydroxy-2-naphthoate octaprenyltransferase [Enhygromyxa salina]
MSPWGAWVQAARPLAAANVAVPLILGQVLAYAAHGGFSWRLFGAVQLLGALNQLFVVFANDFADREADAINPSPSVVSGGSRVIQEGKLSPEALRKAAWIMLGAMVVVALILALIHQLWWLPVLVVGGAGLMWAYSFAPLRMSYRGHGELLQGLGLGVVLPIIGFYAQAGEFDGLPWLGLLPCFLFGYVGNLLTSLPDYPGDRAANKRTYAVRYGQFDARRHALEMLAVAIGFGWLVVPGLPWWAVAGIIVVPLWPVLVAARLLGSADAGNRGECLRFVMLGAGAANLAMLAWMLAALIRAWVG